MNKFIEYIKSFTSEKHICLLGFGREGRSTYRILAQYCSPQSITIADLNTVDKAENDLPDPVHVISGDTYQDSLDSFDIVFKSPGIVLKKPPHELKCCITSETQVFFSVFREQIIGITGTKGKSTVSSLIYHVLNESGCDCRLAGNIGIPVFDIAEGITEETVIVCELSCHQLEYMTVSPAYAVFLNLYEEHLDHYGSMERYYAAKKNIYLHQQTGDILLINEDIAPENGGRQTVITISDTKSSADIFVTDSKIIRNGDVYNIPTEKIRLLGRHNHYNIAAAQFISKYFIDEDNFTRAISTFSPLAHRLEYVDMINGVRYYDDSISTACATAIEAVKSIPAPGSILIGGMDRGIDYQPLVDYLCGCEVQVICMETSGKRIFDMLNVSSASGRSHYVPHLKEAVELAAKITPAGKSCVLSPASASYGIFKNFEERGDAFKSLVAELNKAPDT